MRLSRNHYKRDNIQSIVWIYHYCEDVSASYDMHSVVLLISCSDIGIRSCVANPRREGNQ